MPCNNYDETKATMRHLDLSADGDDQESALDMKPLEYVEGLMGTLDEHDPIFGETP